jgi:hypothetical protein
LSDAPVNANIIPAGQIVVFHARYTYEHGPQGCMGIFKAVRSFDPTAEHMRYRQEFPNVGDPSRWSDDDRQEFVRWAVNDKCFLEETAVTYLFLEPWPERPISSENMADLDV